MSQIKKVQFQDDDGQQIMMCLSSVVPNIRIYHGENESLHLSQAQCNLLIAGLIDLQQQYSEEEGT